MRKRAPRKPIRGFPGMLILAKPQFCDIRIRFRAVIIPLAGFHKNALLSIEDCVCRRGGCRVREVGTNPDQVTNQGWQRHGSIRKRTTAPQTRDDGVARLACKFPAETGDRIQIEHLRSFCDPALGEPLPHPYLVIGGPPRQRSRFPIGQR
jgi:hypothetical protein